MPAGDLLGALADAAQLFAGRQSVGRAHRQTHLVATLQAGDPDHVELVEIRREDRQELGPLQQRQRRVGGQRQHAGVEVQPAQLAVEVAVLGQRVRLSRGRPRSARRRPVGASGADAVRRSSSVSVGRVSASVITADHSPSPSRAATGGQYPSTAVHLGLPMARVVAVPTPSGEPRADRRGCRCRSAVPARRRSARWHPNPDAAVPNPVRKEDRAATPKANSAEVPVPCRSLTKLRGWLRAAAIASASSLRLQRRQIALQHNDVRVVESRIDGLGR